VLWRFACALVVLAALGVAGPARAQSYAPGQLLVRWKPGLKATAHTDAMASLGASRVALYDIGVELVRVDGVAVEEALARLAQDPRVEYAEPDYLWSIDRVPDDPRYPEQYGLNNVGQTGGVAGSDIGAERAWDRFTGDPEFLIGDIDTGAEYDHPDLAANIWTNPGEIPGNGVDDDHNGYVDDVHGYDFLNHDGDPRDDNGHGTHTAGIIAAVGDNGAGVSGVVWHAKIVVLKFLGANGSGPTSAAVEALQYATRLGVRVTNNSWGGGAFSKTLEDAIGAAAASGALFIAAAGNSRADTDRTPQYPGALPDDCVVTVAATDNADQLASFSNFGATSVDLAAPGVDVLSTYPGADYKTLSGTSMATPFVTGAVAFLMGRFPGMDALQVKARLLQFVDPLPGLAGRCVSGGRLNLDLSSSDPDSLPPAGISDLAVTLPGSNSVDLSWTAPGDDGDVGLASRYELRVATHAFGAGDFESGTRVAAPRPALAGAKQSWHVNRLATQTHYWFAVRARDEFGNPAPVSNVADAVTLGPPHLGLSTTSVSSSATTGNVVSQTVELANDSPGTLEWTALPPALEFGAAQVTSADEPAVKGDDGPARGLQADAAGGPDAFGYRWSDSSAPDGPAFQWVDIVQPANVVALSGDEAVSAPVPLGFSFPFYGRRFTQVRLCTNGYLEFSNDGPLFANRGLPSVNGAHNMIAPFWDDLHFGTGVNRAYLHVDGTRCVITWDQVPRYNDVTSVMTFQCILYPSGEIRYQYGHMTGNVANATLGIQDSSRTVGLQVAFNQDFVRDSLAVRIVPLRQWLVVDPPSGFLLPGERQNLRLSMSATGLGTGTYTARAHFASNDPVAPDTAIDVTFGVTGAPDVVFSPASLDFGAHFTGARDTLSLTVANAGVDPLDVSGVRADPVAFVADVAPFRLLPGEAITFPVVFAPSDVADMRGTLSIASNDPDHPLAQVLLHGVGSVAPVIEATQSLLAEAATPALTPDLARRERSLVLRNTGGAPLVWTASAYQGQVGSLPASVTATGGRRPLASAAPAAAVVPRARIAQVKGATGPGAAALGDGGPDAFGYRWIDSDAPSGPVFAWQEIAAVGRRLFASADDSTARVALPFAFSFYGRTYDSVSVCTNGFLAFAGHDSSLVNTDLPSDAEGVPRALVAPFWTDLDLRAVRGAGRVLAWYDGSKFIVEWKDAVHFSGAGPYSFQVLLWPSGTIEYQYLALGARTNVATIGIQNEAGNVGLRVAYNVLYAHPGLRIRLSHQDDWLAVEPAGGSIPPGASDTVHVRFDARQYKDGDYAGEVRVGSNDALQPLLVVPCALHVGLVRDPAEPVPGTLDAVSHTPLVHVLLRARTVSAGVVATSLRLNDVPVTPFHDITRENDGRWNVTLSAVDVLARSGGARDSVQLSGEYDGLGWFAAEALLRVRPPALTGGPLPSFGADARTWKIRSDDTVDLTWGAPAAAVERYDVAWSGDGGVRWAPLASVTSAAYALVPPDTSSAALVEIVARAGDAVVATWLSAPFVVLPGGPDGGSGAPTRFALRLTSGSPTSNGARFSLELPSAGEADVAVFDLAGARVAWIVHGPLPAGRHAIAWDGRHSDGSRAAPGVYLVRARHPSGTTTLRVIALR
jgi:subtilisin family serine protease